MAENQKMDAQPDRRFLFIVEDLYGGGAEKVLINTAEGLRLRGHDVTVYTLRELIEHELPANLKVVNVSVVNRFTKMFSNVFLEKWQAYKILKKIQPLPTDVIISCSCDKITRHINRDIWFWVHANIQVSKKSNNEKNKMVKKAIKFYSGRRVIGCSKGVVDSLINYAGVNPKEIRYIYNPFNEIEINTLANKEVSLPEKEYFIHVGSFEQRKRHDRLLVAYKASGVATPLLLLGKGKEDEVKRIVDLIGKLGLEDKVICGGFHKNPYPYIKNAKALVLTSDREGLPTVLIEALILRTPVISVDCPSGPKEILSGSLAPFLIPMQDEVALANAIRRMDENPVQVEESHYRSFLAESVLPQFEAL